MGAAFSMFGILSVIFAIIPFAIEKSIWFSKKEYQNLSKNPSLIISLTTEINMRLNFLLSCANNRDLNPFPLLFNIDHTIKMTLDDCIIFFKKINIDHINQSVKKLAEIFELNNNDVTKLIDSDNFIITYNELLEISVIYLHGFNNYINDNTLLEKMTVINNSYDKIFLNSESSHCAIMQT